MLTSRNFICASPNLSDLPLLLQKFLLWKSSCKDVGTGLQRWGQQNLYLCKTYPGVYSSTYFTFILSMSKSGGWEMLEVLNQVTTQSQGWVYVLNGHIHTDRYTTHIHAAIYTGRQRQKWAVMQTIPAPAALLYCTLADQNTDLLACLDVYNMDPQ